MKCLRWLFLGVFIQVTGGSVWAGDEVRTFTVSGEISAKGHGKMVVSLVDKEQFLQSGNEVTGITLILEPATDGHWVFTFPAVTPGVYGIKCLQDTNDNGRLDSGAFGPKEPWGMSRNKRPFMRSPRFDEICFRVDADIDKLMIRVK